MAGTIQKGSEKHKLHLSLLEQASETQTELKVPKRKVKKEDSENLEQASETQTE